MLSVSPCRTRTTVPSMLRAAVICLSSSVSWPGLAGVMLRGRGAGRDLARGEAEQDPGVVGHVEAVGDALEDVGVADAPDAVDDFADPALAEADRGGDAHLAEPGVLAEQPEQRAHVALAQRLADVGAFPEGGRYRRGVECACPHGVPSILPSPGARVTGCDQQLTRLHVISL